MRKVFRLVMGTVLLLGITAPVLAAWPRPTPPTPPTPPTAPTPRPTPPPPPTPPPLPEFPEVSGLYSDPRSPGLLVRVFVHNRRDPVATTASVCVDPDSTATTSAAGWKLPTSNWTYNLNPSSVPASVGRSNLPTIVANSVASWNQALTTASTKPNLVQGANTSKTRSVYDGQNIIAWGNTSRSALGVTYIRYYVASGQVVDVDTIMNRRFPWSWSPTCGATSYDAQNVMAHELGHWYGLDDEYASPYLENTMYGYASRGEVKKTTLTSGDALGVQAIYP